MTQLEPQRITSEPVEGTPRVMVPSVSENSNIDPNNQSCFDINIQQNYKTVANNSPEKTLALNSLNNSTEEDAQYYTNDNEFKGL